MTTASKGLAAALARSTSGEVIALAEMSADQILAGLSDETKAELAAALPAPAAAADAAAEMPGKKKDGCSEDGDEDDAGGEDTDAPPAMKPKSEASDDRVKIVAAAIENDDSCKGKAGLALQMLADDDYASLSGSALVKLIGKTPVEGAAAADPEAGARAEMKNVLQSQGNSNIDAGGAPQGNAAANADSVWDTARANIFPQAGK